MRCFRSSTSIDELSTLKHTVFRLCMYFVLVNVVVVVVNASESMTHFRPSEAISGLCSQTQYPSLCTELLKGIPSTLTANDHIEIVNISVNMTLNKVGVTLYGASEILSNKMQPRVRSAYESCIEMLGDSYDQLGRSLGAIRLGTRADVMTWLSAALTNHDTCMDGLNEVSGPMKDRMVEKIRKLSGLVSNCLALYTITKPNGNDFDGIPIQNRRRLLGRQKEEESKFPGWLRKDERRLLDMPATAIKADIVVAKDGKGTYKTITAAIKAAPSLSSRRTIIYVKAGRYEENNLKVSKKKSNLMLIGDGKGKTIISGGKNVVDFNITTFRTASFASSGFGFIARDITFENWAGPQKHQAVALRVGGDHTVVYRCTVTGYQDTLYVHSNRQFFRDCDIYGTVDFIFGNAAVVFQNCNIYARKPMAMQKVTITAQNRKDRNQVTGTSIHNCRILATLDLNPSETQTFLGRPWKLYSQVVYMQSYIGAHVHPRGWLEWRDTFALDTLYYGEYLNFGPGSSLRQRVKWPGYHIMGAAEASQFTVGQFIFGSSWLPSTGVAFAAGFINI